MGARTLAASILAASVVPLAGCNIVAPLGYLVYGPEKIPAAHALDPDRSTVVIIDDPGSRVSRRQLRAEMGQRADELLLSKAKLKEVVDSRSAMSVLSKDRASEPMSIAEIGAALGAEVVVWVGIDEFVLSPDAQTFAPVAAMRVKVVDATTGRRVWPEGGDGHPVRVMIPTRTRELPSTTGEVMEAERNLALRAGDAIAEVFFAHERLRSVQVKD